MDLLKSIKVYVKEDKIGYVAEFDNGKYGQVYTRQTKLKKDRCLIDEVNYVLEEFCNSLPDVVRAETAEGHRRNKIEHLCVRLDEGAKVPTKAYTADAGLDLYSREDAVIGARESKVFDTGVHVAINEGFMGLLFSKSGLNVNKDLTSEGIIDANYSGSIRVKLYNNGGYDRRINAGDKISQLIIVPIATPEVVIVDEIAEEGRGNNGFGSSGR